MIKVLEQPSPAKFSVRDFCKAHLRQIEIAIIVALTVLALLLRLKGLATQSLWFDEADLIARARQNLAVILKDFLKPGENGPLYTLFFHFWMSVFGTGEAAVRTPSLLAGTAAVPMIYILGRKALGGSLVGLVAAGLVTISPYQIWYSQDAKMYPLAMLLTLGSVYLFLTALERGKTGWWVAYVVLTTLSFYVHLMSVLIVGVEVAYYWLNYRKQAKRPALIALGLLTLPYLPIALWQTRALWDGGVGETWFQSVNLLEMLNVLGRRFAVNRIPDATLETLGLLVYAGLAGLGLWACWPQKPIRLMLALYLSCPVLLFYILSIRIPVFADRYLLIATPAYYLLATWGIIWLGKRFWPTAIVVTVVGLVLTGAALSSVNYSSAPQKEEWRTAMRWLQNELQPGDEIILLPGYLGSTVDYYLKPDDVPIYTIPQQLLDGKDDPALNSYLSAENGIIRGHERAWLIVSPDRYLHDDPKEYVRKTWFDNNTWTFRSPQVFVGVTIYGYTFKQIPGTNADYFPRNPERRTQAVFGDNIRLEGFDLSPDNGVTRYDSNVHLTLYWRKIIQSKVNYDIKIRLLDAAGNDTNSNFAAQPLNGFYPTGNWKTGEAVRDYRDLYIHLPPGKYTLEVTVYPVGQPDQKLRVDNASDKLVLPTTITVVK